MKTLGLAAAVLGCLLLTAGELRAVDSQAIRITPENLDQQETLRFSVECERVNRTVCFDVRVGSVEGVELPELEAHLSVQLNGVPITVCPVALDRVENEVRCEFRTDLDYLKSSVLYLVQRRGGDGQESQTYWLHLNDFGELAERGPVTTGHNSSEPVVPPPGLSESAWVSSDDGRLSLRLSTTTPATRRLYPAHVVVELRNDSHEAITVLRPCGADDGLYWVWLQLFGPDGERIPYGGPSFDYSYGIDAFTTLEPEESIACQVTLKADNFPRSDVAGEYEIRFHYAPDESYRSRAEEEFEIPNVWIGEINSHPVTVEKE